jgi:hypothetical protein
MTTQEISKRIEAIPAGLTGAAWGFAFLKCFQGKGSKLPASTFDRVKQGPSNFATDKGNEILWKKLIYFRWVEKDVRLALTEAKNSAQVRNRANKPIFILIASPDEIATHDLDQGEDLLIPRDELPSYAYFFLPFAGKKKITVTSEALEIDVKATRKMAVLFDEIRKTNPGFDSHDLNVLLARLLFCFYAEDTKIFDVESLFTNSLASHTHADGSDLSSYIATVFRRFATLDESSFAQEYRKFPYVNGGLFENEHPVPVFTEKSRKQLLENGKMDWKSINPDIFGSMFQAIIDPEKRHELGMHYTSRENIMKVISPLFLEALREEFEKSKGNAKKLEALHKRISEMKIFDPACGSGNFLILAYEKLRELEMDIIEAKGEVAELFPRIKINQFHGIEIDDFAHELAMLALWIKEHQMNLIFHARFNTSPAALPLREGANIVRDNATRCDWNGVCPRTVSEKDGPARELEIYVLGNPPYLGSNMQDAGQKQDLKRLSKEYNLPAYKKMDYISCWFLKATAYIRAFPIKYAFVTTNSVFQGEHAALLWRPIFDEKGGEIDFIWLSFKWKNSAAGNAGVTCQIAGIRNKSEELKTIHDASGSFQVKKLNGYGRPLDDIWIYRRSKQLSGLPEVRLGNKPSDGGHLILDQQSKEELIAQNPNAVKWVRGYMGADEFLNKKPRWCLWIPDSDLKEAMAVKAIDDRLSRVRAMREKSTEKSTRAMAATPNKFYFACHQDTDSIIFPRTSSEKREYIPLGFLDEKTIISSEGLAVYNAKPWIFGLLSSKMHMEWTKLVAGRLKTDPRYSSFVYNNLPIPSILDTAKEAMESVVFEIIDIREEFHEMTYADMYDPKKMPTKLLQAHRTLDGIVDRCYRDKPFKDVNERLEHLITLYNEMTGQN